MDARARDSLDGKADVTQNTIAKEPQNMCPRQSTVKMVLREKSTKGCKFAPKDAVEGDDHS